MLNSLRASLAIRLQWFQTALKEKQLSTEHNHTLYINPESIALGIFCYKQSEFVFVPFAVGHIVFARLKNDKPKAKCIHLGIFRPI